MIARRSCKDATLCSRRCAYKEEGESGPEKRTGLVSCLPSALVLIVCLVPRSEMRATPSSRSRLSLFESKPHKARFLLFCSAITSEALNGISSLTRS